MMKESTSGIAPDYISDADSLTATVPVESRWERGRPSVCPISAFLFDVDGVLADTARLHTAAWQKLADEEGLGFNDDTAEALRGLSREDSLRRVLDRRQVAPRRFSELLDRKNRYYSAALKEAGEQIVLPGARLLVAGLRELGMKVAAVSLSRNAGMVLRQARLVSYFDVVIDGNDLSAGDGEVNRFLLAASALGIEPERCVVVEDAAAGIAAAKAAGMRSIGIGNYDHLHAATMVLESLRSVDAGTLVFWMGHRSRP